MHYPCIKKGMTIDSPEHLAMRKDASEKAFFHVERASAYIETEFGKGKLGKSSNNGVLRYHGLEALDYNFRCHPKRDFAHVSFHSWSPYEDTFEKPEDFCCNHRFISNLGGVTTYQCMGHKPPSTVAPPSVPVCVR